MVCARCFGGSVTLKYLEPIALWLSRNSITLRYLEPIALWLSRNSKMLSIWHLRFCFYCKRVTSVGLCCLKIILKIKKTVQ